MDKTVVLITLHGGGFVEGDSTWDGPQTALLMNMNCYVYQLDFVKTTLEECLRSIRTKVQNLARVHKLPFYVLGRSSGGYLAKVLYDEGIFAKAIYLAPVFNPVLRGTLRPMLGKKSEAFFKYQQIPETTKWTDNELLILATYDENVPRECFTSDQLQAANWSEGNHSDAVKNVSEEFMELIHSFVR